MTINREPSSHFGILGLYITVLFAMYFYVPFLFYILLAFLALVLLGRVADITSKIIDSKTKEKINEQSN